MHINPLKNMLPGEHWHSLVILHTASFSEQSAKRRVARKTAFAPAQRILDTAPSFTRSTVNSTCIVRGPFSSSHVVFVGPLKNLLLRKRWRCQAMTDAAFFGK